VTTGALVAATSKHVRVQVPPERAQALTIAAIAGAVAGGSDLLRERPPVSVTLPVGPGLTLDGSDAAAELLAAGLPCAVTVDVPPDAPDPLEASRGLVRALATAIAGVACLQLLVPGAPTLAAAPGLRDPRSRLAWVEVLRSFGVRSELGAFPTPTGASDWRAGADGGLAATVGWIDPPDLFGGAGLRADGRAWSPVAMLLDVELFDLVRQIPLGFDVDDETLAVEVIADVGPAEHFLGEQHTLRHFRETWTSRCMDTSTWEAWEEAGRPEPPDHAAERVRELLATHEVLPLPPDVVRAIEEVMAEHGRDR
jgi:trimethylamine--corrinoid protein Co-methyltransferase